MYCTNRMCEIWYALMCHMTLLHFTFNQSIALKFTTLVFNVNNTFVSFGQIHEIFLDYPLKVKIYKSNLEQEYEESFWACSWSYAAFRCSTVVARILEKEDETSGSQLNMIWSCLSGLLYLFKKVVYVCVCGHTPTTLFSAITSVLFSLFQ